MKNTAIILAALLGLSAMQVSAVEMLRVEPPEPGQSAIDVWESLLKPHYFKDVNLIEDTTVIELTTPYRAEDASLTPLSIVAKFPQSPERYIETIYIIADKNPEPLAGVFHLTPAMGRADLNMRVRINEYTTVRAIAVLNNGEAHMVSNFVKAAGGCSAPLGADLKAAMARMGQMRFKPVGEAKPGEPLLAQFNVSHPNITGMQMDQKTRLITPAHYVKSVKLMVNGVPVMTAETGISISADPSFRFYLKPEPGAEVTAEVIDSEDKAWTQNFVL
jgi:sulfur-oxidizing protein SoxY